MKPYFLFGLLLLSLLICCSPACNAVVDWETSSLYMRSDQYTTFNQTYYGLDDSNTASSVTVSGTVSNLQVGVRIFLLRSTGEREITGGSPVGIVNRTGDGEGVQTNTFSIAETPVTVGDTALIARVYMYVGSSWTVKAVFVSEVLMSDRLEADTWTFSAYTNLTGTAGSVKFGSSTYETKLSSISLEEPPLFSEGRFYMQENDFITFFLLPYTHLIGAGPFATIILFGFGITLYLRYKNFYVILLFMIMMSLGGIFNLMLGSAIWGFVALLGTFALGALYWKVFR